jgi:hypothetical protein
MHRSKNSITSSAVSAATKRVANVGEAVRARPCYVALDLGRGVIIVQIYGDAWSSFK